MVQERELGDEYGWKQVHGDVFRPPSHNLLFATLVGTGSQCAVAATIVILLVMFGDMYTGRGSVLTAVIFVYAGTAPAAGYFGGGLYARLGGAWAHRTLSIPSQSRGKLWCVVEGFFLAHTFHPLFFHEGKEWIRQMLATAALLPATVCSVAFLVNFVAVYYSATRAIPFTTMLVIVAIWGFVVLPLTLVGSVLGRNMAGVPDAPCRVNPVPRPIPEKRWFMEPWVIVLLGGVLPFGSIFIEMYFIFTSFWAYKIYYVYGFTLLVFLILAIVTICVCIVCTYFLLNSEDYRWQWTSFLSGASTAIYVYLYAIYYYFFKTRMFGAFQTSFYFGYMGLLAGLLGVLCGTLGYAGTSIFVRTIYRNVKID